MPVEAIIPLTDGLFGVTPGRASSPYQSQYNRKSPSCKIESLETTTRPWLEIDGQASFRYIEGNTAMKLA